MSDDARHIVQQAGKITCFSGAGLSAPSGVGTFRDPVGGWWTKHDPMKLASPQGFAEDPELVMDWYAERRRQIGHAEPNAAHLALAARTDIVQVTQNTDDLLQRAGCLDVVCATSLADEGLDAPRLSAVVLASPTKNAGRTLQRIGRALRPCGVRRWTQRRRSGQSHAARTSAERSSLVFVCSSAKMTNETPQNRAFSGKTGGVPRR